MLKFADKPVASNREPRKAKPKREIDRKKLRAEINTKFSKSLAYLAQ